MPTVATRVDGRKYTGASSGFSETRRQFLKASGSFLASSTALAAWPAGSYAAGYNWTHVKGAAKDIGSGGGKVWMIGNTPNDNFGYGVYLLTDDPSGGNPWTKMAGAGTRIAVDGDGRAWVINAQGNISRAKGTGPNDGFSAVNGAAKDIGVGGGKVWVIGDTPNNNYGYDVYLLTDDPSGGNPWTKMAGAGTRIAVDGDGRAWVVNAQGNISRANGTGPRDGFAPVNGAAKDVGAGGGKVWVIGNTPDNNFGFDLYLLTGSLSDNKPWTLMKGAGTDIAVDNDGNPWVVNAQGNIYHAEIDSGLRCFNITGCREVGPNIPGAARDIQCDCK